MGPSLSVVVATRNRRDSLLSTLRRLAGLQGSARTVVVDNASDDGTPDAVEGAFPGVEVIRLRHNLGAAARTIGVERAGTDLVAFSDDDSWWEEGALPRAREFLARHPGVGLAAGRIVLPATGAVDPVSRLMARSPLDRRSLPVPRVLGFLACAAIVRAEAFLEVGGFWPPLMVGSEEKLLAIDLEMSGWALVYLDDVVAYHAPGGRDAPRRRRTVARNELWISWMRRPVRSALERTAALGRAACRNCHSSVCREGHHLCLRGIDPSEVARAALELVAGVKGEGYGGGPVVEAPSGLAGSPAG